MFVDGFGSEQDGFPYINTDKIAVLEPQKKAGKIISYRCRSVGGTYLGTISPRYKMLLETREHRVVVPDNTGAQMLHFWYDEDGDVLEVESSPVIAWEIIDRDPAKPLTCEMYWDIDDNNTINSAFAIQFPDGVVTSPSTERRWKSRDAAAAAIEDELRDSPAKRKESKNAKKDTATNQCGTTGDVQAVGDGRAEPPIDP